MNFEEKIIDLYNKLNKIKKKTKKKLFLVLEIQRKLIPKIIILLLIEYLKTP